MFGELLSVRRPDTALDVGGGDDSERRRLFPFGVLPELSVCDVAALGGVSRRERRGGGVKDTRGEQRERAESEQRESRERAERSRQEQRESRQEQRGARAHIC